MYVKEMETSLVKSVPSTAPTVTQEKTQRGALFSALGIGLSLIGLFAIGGLFLEIPGLVFALYARQRGEKHSRMATVLCAVCLVVQIILTIGLFSYGRS